MGEAINELANGLRGIVTDGTVFFRVVLPLYVSMIMVEWGLYMYRHRHAWNKRDAWTNVMISSMNMAYNVIIGVLLPLGIYYVLYTNFRFYTLPETGWGWALAFLTHDLIYYLDHRIAHRSGFFWAFHSVHHSSEEFNFTVAARGNFLDGTVMQPLYFLMPLLGMSPFQIVVVNIITSLYGIFNHTRLVKNMGFWEYILATPSNHRVHHGSNAKYLDKNYGQVLIIWDWLLGTFRREEEEPTYGLTTNIDTYNPLRIQTAGIRWLWQQMQSANHWSDKLRYLYKPPGWRHDGPGNTAQELIARSQTAPSLAENP